MDDAAVCAKAMKRLTDMCRIFHGVWLANHRDIRYNVHWFTN